MKMKLTYIENILSTIPATASAIRNVDFLYDNIYVVLPDKCSFVMEKNILSQLGISSSFNINVTTLNRIYNEILDNNISKSCIFMDQLESTLLTYTAMKNIYNNIPLFNKSIEDSDFVSSIYKNIQQLKSSNINFYEMIDNKNNNSFLSTKLHQLGLIYQEYENLKNDKIDACDMTTLATLNMNDKYKNTNFIFAYFDEFTNNAYSFLEQLILSSKSSNFLCYKSNNANKNIYDKFHIQKLIKIANNNKIDVEELIFKSKDSNTDFIQKNLFSHTAMQQNVDGLFEYSTYYANDIDGELNYVFEKINSLLNKGITYDDIGIAVFDLNSIQDKIVQKNSFYNYKLHIDGEKFVKNTTLFQLTYAILKHKIYGFSILNIKNIVSNIYTPLTDDEKFEIMNFLSIYNPDYDIFKNIPKNLNAETISCINKLGELIESIGNLNTNSTFKDLYDNFIKLFCIEEKNSELIEYYYNKALFSDAMYLQNIITNISEIIEILNNSEQNMFLKFFNLSAEIKKMKNLPIGIDNILIADSNSFFERKKYIFLLNCNKNTAPIYLNDNGLITDNEINALTFKFSLSPTILHINKQSKFKLYNLSILFSKGLFISNHSNLAESESILTTALDNLLSFNMKENDDMNLTSITENYEKHLLKTNPIKSLLLPKSVKTAIPFITAKHNCNNFENLCFDLATLYDADTSQYLLDYKNIKNGKNAFLSNNFSVSQLETYFACPFRHFLQYNLKIQQQKTTIMQSFDIGNIFHYLAKTYTDSRPIEDLKGFIVSTINSFFQKDRYNHLANNVNEKFLNNLYIEGERFLNNLEYNISTSSYIVNSSEYYLLNNKIQYNINGHLLNLTGSIDRVDLYENYFVIIDYKTGNINNNLLQELYIGKKIQIFLYANALKKQLINIFKDEYETINIGGLFYYPIRNNFEKDSSSTTANKQIGVFNIDTKNIKALDNNLSTENISSDKYNISLKKESTEDVFVLKENINNTLTNSQLEKFLNYSEKVSVKALNEIMEGNILPSPQSHKTSVCSYCDYKHLCKNELFCLGARKTNISINKNTNIEEL